MGAMIPDYGIKWECGERVKRNAVAAPATVSGEPKAK